LNATTPVTTLSAVDLPSLSCNYIKA